MNPIVNFFRKLWQHRWFRNLVYGLLTVAILFIALPWFPTAKAIASNPTLRTNGDVQIIAHSAGKGYNPEDTMKALKESGERYHTDVLEFDLQMTKDNYLVLNHDDTINQWGIDETSPDYDTPVYVRDLTLAELEAYNLGVNFQDDQGNYPYRGLSIEEVHDLEIDIVTVNEVFEYFENLQSLKTYEYTIEIKNSGDLGLQAAEQLVDLIEQYDLVDRVVLASFHAEVGDYVTKNHPSIMRSGYYNEILVFLVATWLHVDLFVAPKAMSFQIPMSQKLGSIRIDLTSPSFITRAHKHNISVQYWTVNNEDDMRLLIANGADGIMTDYPEKLFQILVELGIRTA